MLVPSFVRFHRVGASYADSLFHGENIKYHIERSSRVESERQILCGVEVVSGCVLGTSVDLLATSTTLCKTHIGQLWNVIRTRVLRANSSSSNCHTRPHSHSLESLNLRDTKTRTKLGARTSVAEMLETANKMRTIRTALEKDGDGPCQCRMYHEQPCVLLMGIRLNAKQVRALQTEKGGWHS